MTLSQVPGGGGPPRPFHSIGRVPEDRSGQGNVCRIERKKYGRVRTVLNLILMLPTLAAPTGIMLNKPYRQRPSMVTRLLSMKRFCRCLAVQGETENSPLGYPKSPVNEQGVES